MSWTVDVTDHGAVGDGSTDDTAALQAALDAAEGMWCVLPPGTYTTNRLWVRPRTTVAVLPGATLKLLPQPSSDWGGALNVVGTEQDPITGVTIMGGGTVDGSAGTHQSSHLNVEGIDVENAVDCHVQNLTVVDAESEGIDFDESEDCTVDHVTLRNCGGFGVHLSHGNSRIKVSGSTAIGCGHTHDRGGFDTHATANRVETFDCEYSACTAVDCYRGFWIKAERTTLTGCRSTGGTVNDLRVSGSGTDVTGFTSKNSAAHGITVEGSAERAKLTSVTVRTATLSGIRILSGASHVSVSGGHIMGCGGNGVWTTGSDGLVAGNLVRGNATNPQIRDTGSNNTIVANKT